VKFMNRLKQLMFVGLVLLCAAQVTAHKNPDERSFLVSAPLLNELDQWVLQTDFWRLVTRGEQIQARIVVSEKASPAVEAWLCGSNHICLTTGLRRYLSDTELQAAIAHEIGHVVIPRPQSDTPQLWEIQCDVFAAALVRDADLVKSMLHSVNRACRDCSDQQHLAPLERAALLDYVAAQPLEKIRRLDALRESSFGLPLGLLQELTSPKRTTP
jgi:hypothetical protein